ncbi:MAG TPA: HisA/HisF-related TIM barrel protein, partial [Candidatus Dormibacteraeota bacterium]|nr:HisA/HisF-related TIM barrel protein [Candidatus Dormibacteraeota bacterium]
QGGEAVQLVHGRRRELTVHDVFKQLAAFAGYEGLHIIDLDAATGDGDNEQLMRELCETARRKYKMRVRVGGGIRTVARARKIAGWKPDQIIVGSAAFKDGQIDTRFLRALRTAVGAKRIVIALDTAASRITIHGWRRKLKLSAAEVMPQLEPYCSAFLCTDVDREGTMSGANLGWFRELRRATRHPIIAAGGIKTRREIAALGRLGMDAAVGMAMYKKRLR